MSTVIATLPIGGASVDIGTQSALKAFNVTGSFEGSVILELSADGTNWTAVGSRMQGEDPLELKILARYARAVSNAYSGQATAYLSASGDVDTVLVRTLTVPTSNTPGTAVDISDLGDLKTLIIRGNLIGDVIIEVSNDGSYSPIAVFSGAGSSPITIEGSWKNIRARTSQYFLGSAVLSLVAFPVASGADSEADWSPLVIRNYILDGDNGNDSNIGYIDALPGTDLSLTAPAVALKTVTRLMQILPINGNNLKVAILVKRRAGGATYKAPDGISEMDWIIRLAQYSYFHIHGTDTNTTANSVAFKNDTADMIFSGGQQASGTNAGGYNVAFTSASILTVTAGSPTTVQTTAAHNLATGDMVAIHGVVGVEGINGYATITVTGADTFTINSSNAVGTYVSGGTVKRWKVTLAGGGAPGFTADSSSKALLGMRFRWDAATTTSALRNTVTTIGGNGTDTIVPTQDMAASPAGTDVGYIEEPGVAIRRVDINISDAKDLGYGNTTTNSPTVMQGIISGMRTTVGFNANFMEGVANLAFCHGSFFRGILSNSVFFRHQFLNLTTINGDIVTVATVTTGGCRIGDHTGATTSGLSVQDVTQHRFEHSCYVAPAGNIDYMSVYNVIITGISVSRGFHLRWVGAGAGIYSSTSTTGQFAQFTGYSSTLRPNRIMGTETTTGLAGIIAMASLIRFQGVQLDFSTAGADGIAPYGTGGFYSFQDVFGTALAGYGISFISRIASVRANQQIKCVAQNDAGNSNGVHGVLGDVGMSVRPSASRVGSNLAWTQLNNDDLGLIQDPQGNSIEAGGKSSSPSDHTVCVNHTLGYIAPTATAVARYRAVRVSATNIALAQANSAANATGVLGITNTEALSTADSPPNQGCLVSPNGSEGYILFDRTGAHPAPTLGTTAYLSVDTAGLAQADVPATAATNQRFVLGKITKIHPTNTDIACVQVGMSPETVLA